MRRLSEIALALFLLQLAITVIVLAVADCGSGAKHLANAKLVGATVPGNVRTFGGASRGWCL